MIRVHIFNTQGLALVVNTETSAYLLIEQTDSELAAFVAVDIALHMANISKADYVHLSTSKWKGQCYRTQEIASGFSDILTGECGDKYRQKAVTAQTLGLTFII